MNILCSFPPFELINVRTKLFFGGISKIGDSLITGAWSLDLETLQNVKIIKSICCFKNEQYILYSVCIGHFGWQDLEMF